MAHFLRPPWHGVWRCQILSIFLVTLSTFAAPSWSDLARRPEAWYRSDEGRRITTNILSWQSPAGSWPKNKDTRSKAFAGDRQQIKGTFDNGATTDELRFLARAFRVTQQPGLHESVTRGVAHILRAQYPTGGWPQSFPPGTQYHRHITFNDGTMVRLMHFVRDVARAPEFNFVDAEQRRAAQAGFERGIACILKCQIVVDGKLTVWCAQHDEQTLAPRSARTYELVSLSGAESAGLLQLLMSLDRPTPEVVRAIEAGAAWYESSRITGLRQAKQDGDNVLVNDPTAPPLWARFYELDTNRPIFSGRDGVKQYALADIERERRNGYAWYGDWGSSVARDFAKWKLRLSP